MPTRPPSSVTGRAEQFDQVDAALVARWRRFGATGEPSYPNLLGFVVEDVRHGYCRMRLPFRPDLKQAGGVVHGGALASLLDSVLVPAIGVTLPPRAIFTTVDLHVQFIAALVDEDAVAEGWIVRQGGRTVFGESEARASGTGRLLARSLLTFAVPG
jgi:acyl-CoA thioesterase